MTERKLGKLKNIIEDMLSEDQQSLHDLLTQSTEDKIRASFYEGSAAAFRTVLLILEHESYKEF